MCPDLERIAGAIMTVVDLGIRRRSPWVRRLVLMGVVALAAVLVWVIWFSHLFSVNEVRVVGASGEAADAVVRAAQVPVGAPLAQLDAATIAERVRALAWVGEVEVRRGWPNSVVLAVEEREGIARVEGQLVDAEGVAFTPIGMIPRGLPQVRAEGAGLAAAMEVYIALPDKWRERVVRVAANSRDDVTLTLRSGAVVRWGGPDRSEFKAQVLDALIKRKAAIYDVSAPELPTTRGKNR
jgi:cell division protein FtsQ